MSDTSGVTVRGAARVLALGEALAGAALGAWALGSGYSVWAALCAVAMAAFGVRAAGFAALAIRARGESLAMGSPWPSMGARSWAAFAWRGAFCALKIHWIELACGPRWNRGAELDRALAGAGEIVVAVPGYACGASPLWRWARAFEEAGFAPCRFEYSDALGSIDEHADELKDFIDEIAARSGRTPWLAGHSMGGLIAMKAVVAGAKARGVATVGTPLEGTRRSSGGFGKSAKEMARDAPWLADLKKEWLGQARPPLLCVWSSCDPIVSPNASASGQGWHPFASRRWDGVGHLELVGSEALAKGLATELLDLVSGARGNQSVP